MDILELLEDLGRGTWYNDQNGPWGYRCPECLEASEDSKSNPPHYDKCRLMEAIRFLEQRPKNDG